MLPRPVYREAIRGLKTIQLIGLTKIPSVHHRHCYTRSKMIIEVTERDRARATTFDTSSTITGLSILNSLLAAIGADHRP